MTKIFCKLGSFFGHFCNVALCPAPTKNRVLVLQFKRWVTSLGVLTKDSHPIHLEDRFALEDSRYKLLGVINHQGNGTDLGMYFSFNFCVSTAYLPFND